jgi:hypothetical protein
VGNQLTISNGGVVYAVNAIMANATSSSNSTVLAIIRA